MNNLRKDLEDVRDLVGKAQRNLAQGKENVAYHNLKEINQQLVDLIAHQPLPDGRIPCDNELISSDLPPEVPPARAAWVERGESGQLGVNYGDDIKEEHWKPEAREQRYEVWYVKPNNDMERFFNPKEPNTDDLRASHTKIANYMSKTLNLDKIYYDMQGEVWSPRGEANDLVRSLELVHTSMSIGDVVVTPDDKIWMVDKIGFRLLN